MIFSNSCDNFFDLAGGFSGDNSSGGNYVKVTLTWSEAAKEMQNFVSRISNYAKTARDEDQIIINPDFIIIPQNGVELAFNNTNRRDGILPSYVNAIDGIGVEELFYNDKGRQVNDNDLLDMLNILKGNKKIMVSDYVLNDAAYNDSIEKNYDRGFIAFPRTSQNYGYKFIPDKEIQNENSKNIDKLSDAQNYLYMIGASNINAIAETNYDVVLIDMFNNGRELQPSDLAKIRYKKNGGRRLLISYINVGSAENFRYYWKNDLPYLVKPYPGYPEEYYVAFWQKDWQDVIFGSSSSYIHKILKAGFDGAYLDNVEAYKYIF